MTFNCECHYSKLVLSAIECNIDVICVQKHRQIHKDIGIKYHELYIGWTLVITSADTMNSSVV